MSAIDKLFKTLAEKKLGTDFEQRVMENLESQICDQNEIMGEITEHYEAIIHLLSPDYQSVKLDKNDLLTIYIDDVKYDLDDKSSAKKRKAAEHRMAIECLISDFDEDYSNVIEHVEKYLNKK